MKKLVLSLLLVFASVVKAQNVNSLDPTQVYNTGNLTTFNQNGSTTTTPWQNVGQWGGQLTCWAPGGPGYCGPNPFVNASGQGVINFSYGYTDLYQVVNITNALPNSGTGLRVNGFNFGFMAKNGNGWDNGQQDFLAAYVSFYDNKGQLTRNYNYSSQTNQLYNWTQFNFSETFTTPYASKDLSTARYGFVGYDTNFWAGPYGPEIYNVSFSLKYSVDPCYTNVLSSPSCPGYMEELAKLTPKTSVPESINTQTNNTIIEPLAPTNTTTSIISNTGVSSSSPNNQVAIVATTPSTTITATVPTSTNNTSGTSIGLSIVARNQQREQSIAMQAAQNAVAAADQAGQQAQQDAVNIATVSSSNSTMGPNNQSNRGSVLQSQRQDQSVSQNIANSSQLQLFQAPTNVQSSSRSLQSVTSTTTTNFTDTSITQSTTTNIQGSNIESSIFSLLPPSQAQTSQQNNSSISQNNLSIQNNQPLMLTTESTTSDSQKFLTDRTNPLYQALENNTVSLQSTNTLQQGSTVNKNAQNNELAGGVDINRIAQAPTGYNEYLSLVLRDGAFYAPKEVYRNQKVIDNTRVLRRLSSDRLHNEMVEQQYRR